MSYLIPIDGPTEDEPEPREPSPHTHRPPSPPYRFVALGEHERILEAVARAIAARSFQETTIQDICAAGEVSPKIFYEHFPGKREAAIASVEAGADQLMAHCQEAFQRASTWPEAIWDALQVYTEWMACNPAFARLTLVEILAIGPPGQELLHSLLDAFALFLAPGYGLAADTPAARLMDEQVANKVFDLLHEHLARRTPQTLPTILPELVRATLTPFLGAQRTGAFVTERQGRDSG